jgi:hypothetical protein
VNAEKYILIAASRSEVASMVLCWATPGGQRKGVEAKQFLVEEKKYHERSEFGYVIADEIENVINFLHSTSGMQANLMPATAEEKGV